jgi:hypothetical protein
MLRLASLTATLLLAGACANQGDEGMIVLNNTAISGSCALTGDPGQPFTSHGEIFALSNKGYLLTPLIQSRVSTAVTGAGNGSTTTVDPLTKTIFLDGADVKLTLVAATIEQGGSYSTTQLNQELPAFRVLFSGSLPPEGTVNVGFEVISPAQLRDIVSRSGANITGGQNLQAEVSAEVTITGKLGGDSIKALPFTYPISVCTDCIVNNIGACPATTTVSTGNACNMFQDGVVDCCSDGTGSLVCPAPM